MIIKFKIYKIRNIKPYKFQKDFKEPVRTIRLNNGYSIDLRKIKNNIDEDRSNRDFLINSIYFDMVQGKFVKSEKVCIILI